MGDVKPDSNLLSLKFAQQGEPAITIKVKASTKFDKIMAAYAAKKSIDVTALKFMTQGVRIEPDDTTEKLELEDGDQVDVYYEQVGGVLLK